MEQVKYEESFGAVVFPEGFEEALKGRTIAEQMERFRTTGSTKRANTGWSSRTWDTGYRRLEDDADVKALILRDGILVGVMISDDCGRRVPCMPEERICTYYDCENNGAGYKVRCDYTWLVCVPENFSK